MKRTVLTSLLALVFLSFVSTAAFGVDLKGKMGLSVHGGGYKLGLTDHSDYWTIGGVVDASLKYGLTKNWVVGVEGTGRMNWLADTSKFADGAGFTFDNLADGPQQRAFSGGLLAEYHFMPEKKLSPYVSIGAGIYLWKWRDKDGNTLMSDTSLLNGTGVPDTDKAGNPYELKDQELYGMLGLGVEYFISENFSWELGGRARYLSHFLTDFKDDKDIVGTGANELDLPKLTAEVYTGFSFYFGGKVGDEDLDGVSDKKDKCPGTRVGCRVDADGCPVDSDGDGVCDGIDACANSPKGVKVDSKGCPTDSDGDGVSDGTDKCDNTPKGCTVDAAGCPTDADGDGVCDGLDKCADTPRGCTVDASGCQTDSDGDGVCDGVDQCPNTPAGSEVNAVGCVLPKVEYIPTPEKPLVLKGVNFQTGKAVLLDASKTVLDEVAISLMAHPEVKVEVGGHTDATGSDAHNLNLSEQRATAVRNYLVEKGVKAENLFVKGYGETTPIADNKTVSGRAQNRRVELKRVQ
ncbi:MAG: OmpA family protein [candidate division Zixibacteria bacterium]|nr:OmpA family protein [candidate division Zixibacteria bacterium]